MTTLAPRIDTIEAQVNSSGLKGSVTGSAVAAGYVGEKISSVSGTLTASASQVWANATSINLSAGVWLVSGTIVGRTVVGFTTVAAYISTTNTITGPPVQPLLLGVLLDMTK